MKTRAVIERSGSVLIAAVFILSGIGKLLWNHSFERALRMYPVTLTALQMDALLVGLPVLEVTLGIVVCTRRYRRAALYGIFFLIVGFTALQIRIKAVGLDVPCGCFGVYSPPVSTLTIAHNVLLAGVVIVLTVLTMLQQKG